MRRSQVSIISVHLEIDLLSVRSKLRTAESGHVNPIALIVASSPVSSSRIRSIVFLLFASSILAVSRMVACPVMRCGREPSLRLRDRGDEDRASSSAERDRVAQALQRDPDLSSAEKCRRVAPRMSFTTCSAGFLALEDLGLIFVPSVLRSNQNPL